MDIVRKLEVYRDLYGRLIDAAESIGRTDTYVIDGFYVVKRRLDAECELLNKKEHEHGLEDDEQNFLQPALRKSLGRLNVSIDDPNSDEFRAILYEAMNDIEFYLNHFNNR